MMTISTEMFNCLTRPGSNLGMKKGALFGFKGIIRGTPTLHKRQKGAATTSHPGSMHKLFAPNLRLTGSELKTTTV